jgi:hypothetical protein
MCGAVVRSDDLEEHVNACHLREEKGEEEEKEGKEEREEDKEEMNDGAVNGRRVRRRIENENDEKEDEEREAGVDNNVGLVKEENEEMEKELDAFKEQVEQNSEEKKGSDSPDSAVMRSEKITPKIVDKSVLDSLMRDMMSKEPEKTVVTRKPYVSLTPLEKYNQVRRAQAEKQIELYGERSLMGVVREDGHREGLWMGKKGGQEGGLRVIVEDEGESPDVRARRYEKEQELLNRRRDKKNDKVGDKQVEFFQPAPAVNSPGNGYVKRFKKAGFVSPVSFQIKKVKMVVIPNQIDSTVIEKLKITKEEEII